MISYFKTQWFRCLVGCVCLGLSIYYLFQPGADESALEGLAYNLENSFTALCLFLSSMIWFISSCIEYNNDRIELLEKKAEKYDALAEEVKAMRELQQISDKLTDQRLKKLEGKK